MRADQIIIEPVLSEKSNLAREAEMKKYTFRVHMDANKHMISDAVSKLFKVDVVKCNVMIVKGKPKYSRSRGGSIKGTTGNWKKAVVTLAKGDSIQAIEGV
ncbi:MAG TPA: 50S ribosomal protein L23 [Sphaerochaeta sp.]|jgi:large subunit ribosomal protein L23|nr:50S ribosomal protein L23 [Spirochaetota bacterium]NLL24488.1 50S ribosomal protein L23 [Spirochaetales bacterium]TAH58524.1 MAG: 50S ribosomal protein L23 [Sphaerochaeta sp.]HOE88765.1 50S ribosomal protein L23 [Sphaerochaeta sp.]HOR79551.1 50S ribosomal protein L23 [Sphaerochaeta sp.]